MTDPDAVATVLEERPDLEEPLEAVLAVDHERETWTFDDVPIESGPFGELVSRDIVEAVGEEYRIADPAAVRTALVADGSDPGAESDRNDGASLSTPTLPSVDPTTWTLVAAAVAFVGLVRLVSFDSVYRDGTVVLSGNDPYYYRFWVERAITEPGLPEGVREGEPLLVATLAWLSDVLGGTVDAVGHVMAWYPVATAMIGALVVYLLAVHVTGDRRVGLAAVVVLALIPGHAMRTGLGYADHHAFDYVWLGVTALAVAKLAGVNRPALRQARTWALVGLGGVTIAAQVLAWNAGPLLLVPLGILVAARAAIDVRRDRDPLPAGLPLVATLGLGAAIAVAANLATGFQDGFVVAAPGLLAAGSAGTLVLAIATHRVGWDVRRLLAGYVAGAVLGVVVLATAASGLWGRFVARLGDLFGGSAIAETQGLFDPSSFGFLFLFGLTLLLALPPMVLGVRRSLDDGRWLVLTTYAWYFFALSVVQIRFVGELATFAAVFGGYGFVWAAAWIDAIPRPDGESDGTSLLRIPNRRVIATLFVLMLLFGGFGALQVGVKTSQVTIEDDTYGSATFVADHVEGQDLEYPENYVLSEWGRNRVYNYFVSGQSEQYLYARNTLDEFLGGTDPDSWYNNFQGRVGYVVVPTDAESAPRQSTLWQLGRNYGSADGDVAGAGHFRALYEPPGESRVVYEVVPGSVLNGTTAGNATVTVSTTVDLGADNVTYERRTAAHESGAWNVRVANPGTYEVEVGGETTTVGVPAEAVYGDERVSTDRAT